VAFQKDRLVLKAFSIEDFIWAVSGCFFFPKPHAASEGKLHVVDIPRDFVMSAEMGSLLCPWLFLAVAALPKPHPK